MAITYEPIATTTLGSATATVTFSSITGSYTDLVLIINAAANTSGDDLWLRFNSDTGTNYSLTTLLGNGTSASSTRRSSFSRIMSDAAYPTAANGFNQITNIMDYSNTTTYKTVLIRSNNANTSQYVGATVGLWRSTSAITSIDLTIAGAGLQFASGSTFTLYGIKEA